MKNYIEQNVPSPALYRGQLEVINILTALNAIPREWAFWTRADLQEVFDLTAAEVPIIVLERPDFTQRHPVAHADAVRNYALGVVPAAAIKRVHPARFRSPSSLRIFGCGLAPSVALRVTPAMRLIVYTIPGWDSAGTLVLHDNDAFWGDRAFRHLGCRRDRALGKQSFFTAQHYGKFHQVEPLSRQQHSLADFSVTVSRNEAQRIPI